MRSRSGWGAMAESAGHAECGAAPRRRGMNPPAQERKPPEGGSPVAPSGVGRWSRSSPLQGALFLGGGFIPRICRIGRSSIVFPMGRFPVFRVGFGETGRIPEKGVAFRGRFLLGICRLSEGFPVQGMSSARRPLAESAGRVAKTFDPQNFFMVPVDFSA